MSLSERLSTAISGPVAVKQANDRIEATLPDPEIDHRSRSGPLLPLPYVKSFARDALT
jgi:hypothetical protein